MIIKDLNMKIIAIDSSSNVASVAIIEGDITVAEYSTNFKLTHSQTLLPMIDEIVSRTNTDLKTVDAIAISEGPGSFTGLRIGSATGKGLALALDIPVVNVPTLMALAANFIPANALVCPIMDARRDQVYTAIYRVGDGVPETVMEDTPLSIEELIEKLNELGESVIFTGDGIVRFKDTIDEKLKVEKIFAGCQNNRQRAASVGYIGMKLLEMGKQISGDDHVPNYLRLSQAERELKEKQANDN